MHVVKVRLSPVELETVEQRARSARGGTVVVADTDVMIDAWEAGHAPTQALLGRLIQRGDSATTAEHFGRVPGLKLETVPR